MSIIVYVYFRTIRLPNFAAYSLTSTDLFARRVYCKCKRGLPVHCTFRHVGNRDTNQGTKGGSGACHGATAGGPAGTAHEWTACWAININALVCAPQSLPYWFDGSNHILFDQSDSLAVYFRPGNAVMWKAGYDRFQVCAISIFRGITFSHCMSRSVPLRFGRLLSYHAVAVLHAA